MIRTAVAEGGWNRSRDATCPSGRRVLHIGVSPPRAITQTQESPNRPELEDSSTYPTALNDLNVLVGAGLLLKQRIGKANEFLVVPDLGKKLAL